METSKKQGKVEGEKGFYKTRCHKVGHFNEKDEI